MLSFKSIESAIAKVAHDIVVVAKAAEPILKFVDETAPVVETITGLINPAAVIAEQAAYNVLGKVVAGLQAASTLPDPMAKTAVAPGSASPSPASSAEVTIQLTAQELTDLQTVMSAVQTSMAQRNVVVAK